MTFSENIGGIIDDIELTRPYDKAIIKHRFLDEIVFYEKKRDETRKYYNTFRFIVTTGSILLPAVLSMGQMDPTKLPKNFDIISYWFSWTISLMVTGSNGFLQLFSLDKNYFNYSMVVEQLKTEGWQYFGLSGKYEDYPDHQSAYKSFSKSVESIKRKQIEQEFQNGKGENKKKKFDFQGEMKKFSNEQNANLELVNKQAQQQLNDMVTKKMEDNKKELEVKIDEQNNEIIQKKEEIEEKVEEKVEEKKEEVNVHKK
jgi:hypothetical protein